MYELFAPDVTQEMGDVGVGGCGDEAGASKCSAASTSDLQTPAIRVPSMSLALNWFLSRDGRFKIDGAWRNKPILVNMLRRTRSAYRVGNTKHGQKTGKQVTAPKVQQGRNRMEIAARSAWENGRRNKC